ncbi:hypothetical protein CRUP_022280 [Coryphaenoides rupestris]|nr:hypothetical protein CRUP_022280 [Coryphaenoides rupestris]
MSVDEEVNTGHTGSSLTPSPQLLECTAACNNISITTEVKLSTTDRMAGGSDAMAAGLVLPNRTGSTDARPGSGKPCEKPEGDENHVNHSKSSKQQQQPQPPQQHQHQQQKLSKRRNTGSFGFNHPASGKRRRRANSESDSVLPSNFLLGGNIFDPLNLNSLLDEEVSRALNAETPKSSPLPTKHQEPVEILIPRDITDPLNLNSGADDDAAGGLVSPLKSGGGRRRNRNRHHGGGGGGGGGGALAVPQLNLSESGKAGDGKPAISGNTTTAAVLGSAPDSVPREPAVAVAGESLGAVKEAVSRHGAKGEAAVKGACADSMTSPVMLPGGAATNQHTGRRKRRRNSGKADHQGKQQHPVPRPPVGFATPKTDASKTAAGGHGGGGARHPIHLSSNRYRMQPAKKFQYGNYNKYYGYRNPGAVEDPRMRALRPEWFRGKEVLDLGCNAGHLTLHVAKALRPARILGLDIDGRLVHVARQNIRHYLSDLQARQASGEQEKRRRRRSSQAEEEEKEAAAGDKQEERMMEVERKGENGEAVVERGGGDGGVSSRLAEEVRKEEEQETEDRGAKQRQDNGKEEPGRKGEEQATKEEVPEKEVEPQGTKGEQESSRSRWRRREQQRSRMEEVEMETYVDTSAGGGPGGGGHFPVSLCMTRGPIAAPPLTEKTPSPPGEFPANVSFLTANYVLENDALLLTQRAEYDVILCLSVTKWVHLNWGDTGIKRFFQRAYRHLRPGGLFILEPQPWDSYVRRKKLTENINQNYKSIRLKPDQFTNYLTTEVGFASYEFIGTPNSSAKGFQRPIYLFHK